MARNNDRDGIGTVRQADGARSSRVTEVARELAVGGRLAKRNVQQGVPDALLEFGSLRLQSQIETLQFAGEEGAELTDRLAQWGWILLPLRRYLWWRAAFRK